MKELFEYNEVKNSLTGEVYCHMPKLAWMLTEPKSPLSFMSGTIITSYACDPDRKHGLLFHLLDAFITWWRYLR
jgi:hypothetical protein